MNWNRAFVLVITPDAFVRGLGAEILGEFTGRGLVPSAARVVQPGAPELDALYEDVVANNGSWGTYRYRCVDSLFGLGSSLAIVIHDTTDTDGGDLHERTQRFKGSGPLARAAPDSLRRRYRSVNSILNLIHTSASPTEAELDYSIFFRRDWLTPWHAVASHQDTVFDPIDARFAASQLDRGQANRELRGFGEVRRQFRGRLIAHLWEYLDARQQKAVLQAFERDGARYVDSDELIEPLCASLRERVDPQLVIALSASFTPANPPVDARRLWTFLAGFGLSVDPWERAVLSTSQHFEPADEEQPSTEAAWLGA